MTRVISKVSTNITASSTAVVPPTAPQFSYLLPNSPTQLYSLNIAVDSTFQSGYSYRIVINSIVQDGNNFQLFPTNQTSYEFVPQTWQNGIPLAPNTLIEVYAYNSTSASSDGHMSVSILASTNE